MKNNEKRPILIKGEEYSEFIRKIANPVTGEKPELNSVRKKISSDIESTLEKINNIQSKYLMDELIINVRMNPKYIAKSYHPTDLIKYIGAEDVGSKKYLKEVFNEKKRENELKIGKEIFLKLSKDKLEKFKDCLSNEKEIDSLKNSIITNIQCLDTLFLDTHEELYKNFILQGTLINLEIILHPFGEKINSLLEKMRIVLEPYMEEGSILRYKTYSSGITFISVKVKNKECLEELLKYNGIRTINEINFRGIPNIRINASENLPLPPVIKDKSILKVGVFDGGILSDCEYFKHFANENNPNKKFDSEEIEALSHGTAVVGAILYGNLSKYGENDILKTPKVNVESFKVLPLNDRNDIDLYEIIDKIEEVVPKYKDTIKVYNLSLGPEGAINDDNISRFTYSIDELSKNGDILFVVAVGNDGDLINDQLGRIQAPSDAVNCLGVGSYYYSIEKKQTRAPYSCFGDGREGSKIKPDLLEFGGNIDNEFQLISLDKKSISMACGTSFSAPIVSAKAAEIIGRFSLGNALIAKNLLIHTAKPYNGNVDKFHGHGFAMEDVNEILYCESNKVTITYQSKIEPKKSVKIPIPVVKSLNFKGKVKLEWTIVSAVSVDARNSEDYTLACVEDTFYPNSKKYKLDGKIVYTDIHEELIKKGEEEGMKFTGPSSYSDFDEKYKTEEERKKDFKWDTVIKKITKPIKYSNLNNPYIVLHAMERYSSFNFVNYSIVVTIHYLECEDDVYDLTLKEYNKLEVSKIKPLNELLIKN